MLKVSTSIYRIDSTGLKNGNSFDVSFHHPIPSRSSSDKPHKALHQFNPNFPKPSKKKHQRKKPPRLPHPLPSLPPKKPQNQQPTHDSDADIGTPLPRWGCGEGGRHLRTKKRRRNSPLQHRIVRTKAKQTSRQASQQSQPSKQPTRKTISPHTYLVTYPHPPLPHPKNPPAKNSRPRGHIRSK